MMSGATMRLTLRFSSVVTQVVINPSVVPLSGSTAISGIGMNGAVSGLNHFVQPGLGAGGGAGIGPCGTGTWVPASPGGLSDQHGADGAMQAAAAPAISRPLTGATARSIAKADQYPPR